MSIDGAADTSDAVLGDTGGGGDAATEASGIAPGCLSPELRAALGVSESAPPPWLARMRKLGYPPGYLADDEALAPAGACSASASDIQDIIALNISSATCSVQHEGGGESAWLLAEDVEADRQGPSCRFTIAISVCDFCT